jgi:N6-adenosine-specific RNA methylase IME4
MTMDAATFSKQHVRDEREWQLACATRRSNKRNGVKVYNVLYADPPWRFEPYSRITGMSRAADNHYATMTLDKIKLLEVPAAKHCALFLWATAPMLPHALAVMQAWGFTYKSHWIWVKDRIGTGYWSRNMHELLLIGTRGQIPAPAPGSQPESAMTYPVGRHSAKPPEFRQLIDGFYPNVPKLEMFARGKASEHWDVMGDEAEP